MAEKFVEVNGQQYDVIKTGRAQADQVLRITRWLAKYGVKAFRQTQKDTDKFEISDGMEFITGILESLTSDALVDMFQAIIGCAKEDAELYFDIAVLIEAVVMVYEGQPSVKRLIDRFFSTPSSPESTEESSTKSE